MRNIFVDDELGRAFAENGYCIIKDVINADVLNRLENFYLMHALPAPDSFHTTMYYPDKEYRQMVHEFIVANLQPTIDSLLINYRAFLGNYIVKEPRETSSLEVHQDWSFVDERHFESINMWCPLCDVDENNGALLMLNGSNRLNNLERSPTTPIAYADKYKEWFAELTPCPVKRGDIILFSSRLVHGSFLNKSNRQRLAITLTSIPVEAQAYHYHKQGEKVIKYKIDVPFYYTYKIGVPPGKEWQLSDE